MICSYNMYSVPKWKLRNTIKIRSPSLPCFSSTSSTTTAAILHIQRGTKSLEIDGHYPPNQAVWIWLNAYESPWGLSPCYSMTSKPQMTGECSAFAWLYHIMSNLHPMVPWFAIDHPTNLCNLLHQQATCDQVFSKLDSHPNSPNLKSACHHWQRQWQPCFGAGSCQISMADSTVVIVQQKWHLPWHLTIVSVSASTGSSCNHVFLWTFRLSSEHGVVSATHQTIIRKEPARL